MSQLQSAAKRRLLLSGASLLTLLVAQPAIAQTVSGMRGIAAPSAGASAGSGAPVTTVPPLAQTALARQNALKARVATALDLAQQAQTAARATALSRPSSVPNGLGTGGLDPAVRAATSAASDPTGILTWDGASLPTQVKNADGSYDVSILQNQSRAILSWTTFNVGQNTTLTFDQQGNADWIVLNRVVGQIDPLTGRRDPTKAPLPSQILGSIKSDGTVLVINQNGIIFGAGSQINTHALIATTLEIGNVAPSAQAMAARNSQFLSLGLLGFADSQIASIQYLFGEFGSQIDPATNQPEANIEGGITVEQGASITSSGTDGLILMAAPTIVNAGSLTSDDGQVLLQSGRGLTLQRSTGASTDPVPAVRGLIASSTSTNFDDYVQNTGVIEADRGNITLGSSENGAVLVDGLLVSTTSVARNGSIRLSGPDIELAPNAILSIAADTSTNVVPNDAATIAAFKPSDIFIGDGNADLSTLAAGNFQAAQISIGANSLILAPGGNVQIGVTPGANGTTTPINGVSQVFVDTDATIDVSGEMDVLIPASRNQIAISPVTGNDLADSEAYQGSFLKGATIYVDPRETGVRDDGTVWIGSPLVDAASYYAQVGVTAAELLTKGGNVSLGVDNFSPTGTAALSPNVVVKSGASVNVSGGWVRYQAGEVQTSQLVTADGRVVDVADADPNETYIGFAGSYNVVHDRWGVVDSYIMPFEDGSHVAPGYIEGHDAGTLTLIGSSIAFDGVLTGDAFAGDLQRADAEVGTGTSDVYGDLRAVQASGQELPAGGALLVQASRNFVTGNSTSTIGGGDIDITSGTNIAPLSDTLAFGFGVSIDANGNLVKTATRTDDSLLPDDRRDTISLSSDMLSAAGLSQVTLVTTGAITVDTSADVTLDPGGVFDALAGRTLTVDGNITAQGGQILLETTAAASRLGNVKGSVFDPSTIDGTSYDVVVNGTLSVRGRWVNDQNVAADQAEGGAYLDGGTIVLSAAADVLSTTAQVQDIGAPAAETNVPVDDSGSVLVNAGATLDLTGGGRIDSKGGIDLTHKGGNLVLDNQTAYFQLTGTTENNGGVVQGTLPGLRAGGMTYGNQGVLVASNPAAETSTVTLDGTILAHGFGGGGSFSLTTPAFALGDGTVDVGTELPLDFFSKTGFASYDITSYKTALTPSDFKGTTGGYDALLAVQTVTIGAGQVLDLTQSTLPAVLDAATSAALHGLASGGDVLSVVAPSVPTDTWDQQAVSLTLGGALELHVDQGGAITGAPGAQLTVGGLLNEGSIRLAGGTITQSKVLPTYLSNGQQHAFSSLSDIFSYDSDGQIDETQPNALGLTVSQIGAPNSTANPNAIATNGQVAQYYGIYLKGLLDGDQGIVLAPGSVTDLSGTVVLDPHASAGGVPLQTGRVVAGGTLATAAGATNGLIFQTLGNGSYGDIAKSALVIKVLPATDAIDIDDGATLDLSGAWGVFDQPVAAGGGFSATTGYAPTLVWSDAGTLAAPLGLSIDDGAVIKAQGGSVPAGDLATALGQTQAEGGTLEVGDLVLTQHDAGGQANTVSADRITGSGFTTLVAWNSLTSSGDVDLTLGRGFFLEASPYSITTQPVAPTLKSDGGTLSITAPYVRFDGSNVPTIGAAGTGAAGTGTVSFDATQIDFVGSVLIDPSVATAHFDASGDIRLIGVNNAIIAGDSTLTSQIVATGDLDFTAAQLYATTGSIASITTAGADSTISFARSGSAAPDAPYSAGSSLTVQAAHIVQDGVIRAPLGTLTLGSSTALTGLAPATQDVTLGDGSITSVSAGGLSIPYGTTTDQTEWYFAPGGADPLTSEPAAILKLSGTNVAVNTGATVDLSGGGDVYAYEFVPGNGGSHDVLSRENPDVFTGNNGLQYADGRQIYAIVPGLSNAIGAAYDPIYSADYGALGTPTGVGSRVWLDGGNGLAAGWYTLLPAQYATLPGGFRVVEETGIGNVKPDTLEVQTDGASFMSGHFGDAASGTASSTETLFDVESQAVVYTQSRIALTSGNSYFATLATTNGDTAARTALDAGRLVLAATSGLTLDGDFDTAAAAGGRGGQVDIAASAIEIGSTPVAATGDGVVHVTAAGLDNLNADSLLIGGIRTDNADGTTNIDVTAQSITVDNDAAHPLSAPEILLAVDDQSSKPQASSITLADGAAIVATGTLDDTRTGAYVIDARASAGSGMTGEGVVLRVANGPERLVTRLTDATAPAQPAASLTVGAATLDGQAVLLDSTGAFALDQSAALTASDLALGAGEVTFADDASGLSGLVITPELRARLTGLTQLTVRTRGAIGFDAGSYDLGGIRLDAAGIEDRDGGTVTLTGTSLTLSNQTGASLAVGDGTGTLDIATGDLIVGPGTMTTQGFGTADIAASTGIYGEGTGGLDFGDAAVAIHTPYIGDRADAGATVPAKLTLATTGLLSIDATGAAQGFAAPAVATGGSLTLDGGDIAVAGTTLRETAGTITLDAAGGVTLSNGATIATPGYDKNFADAVDPATASAPAGQVTINALGGDITLGAGTTLSVGGGTGNAGTLTLSAANGAISFGGTLDGKGETGGGNLTVETRQGFDLAATGTAANADGFTGLLSFISHQGDLVLDAGQTIKAGALSLVADGGTVDIAGTIDTSGVNGGDVSLYGLTGVTLAATARIDATATGYAADDARQAKGGDVTLGVDGSGAITVADGALIDVSAQRPGDRLVQILRGSSVDYEYVAGDLGGTVTFRAPVIEASGGDTVNVDVASAASVKGASSIVLEGFKTWDLGAVAASGAYSGVTYDPTTDTITLDPSADLDTANPDGSTTAVGGVNFLGDAGAGTVTDFIQNFDVSQSYAHLGGLAGQANFQAAPGVDLAYSGNVVLASNWNLGAGAVNLAAAEAAGLVGDNGLGQYYVNLGDEAALFARYTQLQYRVGGKSTGAAPIVDLRAGGNLAIDGSISDGYFEFADPNVSDLGAAAGSAIFAVETVGTPSTLGYYWYDYSYDFLNEGNSTFYSTSATSGGSHVYYSAEANSAAPPAITDQASEAVLFPEACADVGCTTLAAPSTTSFRLVAGADLASVDPAGLKAGSTGAITVEAYRSVTSDSSGDGSGGGYTLEFDVADDGGQFGGEGFPNADMHLVTIDQFAANIGESNFVDFNLGDYGIGGTFLTDAGTAFSNALNNGTDPALNALIATYGAPGWDGAFDLNGAAAVVQYAIKTYFLAAMTASIPNYYAAWGLDSPFPANAGGGSTTKSILNVIRTGTGSITMAAAGNLNLYDPATDDPSKGGAAITTSGVATQFTGATLPDPVTGKPVTLAAPTLTAATAGGTYLTGGGDITLHAGGSIVSARNPTNSDYLVGFVDNDVDLAVQPAMSFSFLSTTQTPAYSFVGGVGALGGGDVTVTAGQDIVDLEAVSGGSAVSTAASGSGGAALVAWGRGNVDLTAGGDLLGGRVDVWAGDSRIVVAGDIASAGAARFISSTPGLNNSGTIDDLLRLRTFDSTIDVAAGGDETIQGISALAPHSTRTAFSNPNWANFYGTAAGLSLLAGGSLTVANEGDNLLEDAQGVGHSEAVYPNSLSAVAFTGNLDLGSVGASLDTPILLTPSDAGELSLLAGGNIDGAVLAMLDSDPSQLPGYFTNFRYSNQGVTVTGLYYGVPGITSDTTDAQRALYHSAAFLDRDSTPVRIAAGGDIGSADAGLSLWLPKQARISAGEDIINMMFFGQNLTDTDITRIVAGRDITATTKIVTPVLDLGTPGTPEPALEGNLFVLGGPGDLMIEAGRNLGPFLTSAVLSYEITDSSSHLFSVNQTEPGGILTVGNEWNPLLPAQGANISVMFGVAPGMDYDALRDTYLDPANLPNLSDAFFEQVAVNQSNSAASVSGLVADRSKPIYAPILIDWMQAHYAGLLTQAYGTTDVTQAQAYAVFVTLPELNQRSLLNQVYFNELQQAAIPTSPSYQQYARGYEAVNTLFPSSLGYTQNDLTGGSNGANAIVHTGDLDLRLATIETARGGDIDIFGPGGEVLAGSTVSTAAQAARRAYDGTRLFLGDPAIESQTDAARAIAAIPAGYEGVLTLRGGAISTFTDGDFLLNQSRVFTREGGDITMWSSNADLNAGQGPKTTSDVPPVVERIDADLVGQDDQAASTTGAGIAAYAPDDGSGAALPDVYLLAPRGTVDAGDAGVRVAGNIYVAALAVANVANFQVGGQSFGIPTGPVVDVSANLAASNTAANAVQEVTNAMEQARRNDRPSVITITVDGFGPADCDPKVVTCPAQ